MITSFELLDEGVRVEVDVKVGAVNAGLSSYIISYGEFQKYLTSVGQSSRGGKDNGEGLLTKMWGRSGEVDIPENTIEITTTNGLDLQVRQMIGGNMFPILDSGGGVLVDTSRIIVDFTIEKAQKTIQNVQAYTFTGMLYGFHKPEHIVPNQFLTLKLKADLEGNVVEELREIKTEKVLRKLKNTDIARSTDGSAQRELTRVRGEGGAIRWGEVTC